VYSLQYYTLCSKKRRHFYFWNNCQNQPIFTARCYASAVLAMSLCPSVCVSLSVSVSVTSRCSTKTAKRRITQRTPHDSPGTLVFGCQRSPRNSTGVTPYGGAKCRWGGSKSATFDKYLAISRKRYKIDAWLLLKSNRKSYALYRMVTLPLTLLTTPNHPIFCISHRHSQLRNE